MQRPGHFLEALLTILGRCVLRRIAPGAVGLTDFQARRLNPPGFFPKKCVEGLPLQSVALPIGIREKLIIQAVVAMGLCLGQSFVREPVAEIRAGFNAGFHGTFLLFISGWIWACVPAGAGTPAAPAGPEELPGESICRNAGAAA